MLQHSYKLRGNDCPAIPIHTLNPSLGQASHPSKTHREPAPGYLNPTPYPTIPMLLSWHGMDGTMRSEIDIVELMQPTISQWA